MRPAGNQAARPPLRDVLQFVVERSNERVLVLDADLTRVFLNEKAGRFLQIHALPEQINALARKIFAAIARGNAGELFPGQICLQAEIGERHWVFRVSFREGEQPLVAVFFTDETVSSRFDLNSLRRKHQLTRRETDALRHLLDGLRNHEIAEELAITEQTVKEYLSSIYRKVGAPDRFSLLRYLICASQE